MGISIRSKWTLALLGVAAVPLALVGMRGLDIQREGLRMVEQELEAAVVDQTASELELAFDELAKVTGQASALALYDGIPPETRVKMLRELVAHESFLTALSLFDAEHAFMDAIVVPNHAAPSNAPLDADIEREARDAGSAVRLRELPNGELTMSYTVCADPRLCVMAWLDVDELRRWTDDLSTVRFAQPDRIDVLTVYNGAVRSLYDVKRATMAAELLPTGDVTSLFAQPFIRTSEFVGAESMSGTLRTVPRAKLAVRVVRPTREAYEALERSRRQLWFALAAVGVLVIALATLLGRQISRPINELVELVRRYARREWSAKNPLTSGDEFQTLGDALSSMAHDIQVSESEIQRRAQVESALARFLPNDVARQIAAGERSIALGGERRNVAVVFADVANFTRFAESRPVEEVVSLLNELFAILSEVVFRHGGMVDKFMGDCVMALFGAGPGASDDPERQAIAAAEDMMRFVEASAEAWRERWGYDIRLGIGVAAGEALVGNLGSETRIEFTAVGDIVNLASRLEGLARPGQVLVTTPVVDKTRDGFEFEALGKVPVRGKSEEVEIFALVTG